MAACSASMAAAHIRMLLYDVTYLGTKQWRESTQRLPTILSILMIDNEATVQIALNGKLTHETCHIEQRFHYVCQGQQDGTHQLHWIPCESQLADILTKTRVSSKIDLHINKVFCTLPDHTLPPTNKSTEIWFKRGVRLLVSPYYILHLSLSLTVARMHSKTLHPCSSNQCNTARLESKLSSIQIHVHLIPWDWTLIFKRRSTPRIPKPTPRHETTSPRNEECSSLFQGTLPFSQTSHPPVSFTPLTIVKITHFLCHLPFL